MEDFDAVMRVNLRGVFLTAREAARRMIAAGSVTSGAGRIVLIASMAGLRPLPGLVPYSVSKAGVVMMTKALAREWARQGINVNALCPGYVETEINADWLATEGGSKMLAGFPRRRVMDDDSLDGALTWLVSDAAKFTTGAIVQIDDAQGI
jgi:NAD(P)-dependent dehydrogenase (short-subunit alcohol dehydrogenase family)